jgi:hypothetical protein
VTSVCGRGNRSPFFGTAPRPDSGDHGAALRHAHRRKGIDVTNVSDIITALAEARCCADEVIRANSDAL